VQMLRWVGSPLLLRTLLLVLGSRWIGGAVVVHHPVHQRSTTGWSGHNLPLLGFLVGMDDVVCDHDIANELWKRPSVLSAMRSCSLVERSIMKRSFFFSSVSTWSGAYCDRWLNCLE
jgi:hypothetical protein